MGPLARVVRDAHHVIKLWSLIYFSIKVSICIIPFFIPFSVDWSRDTRFLYDNRLFRCPVVYFIGRAVHLNGHGWRQYKNTRGLYNSNILTFFL
jgi:hypothetical protein